MTGINFADIIVVRRTVEKGTKIIKEQNNPPNWCGQGFRDYEQRRLETHPNLVVASGKGTSALRLGSLNKTKIPESKGRHIITGKGTGFRIGI